MVRIRIQIGRDKPIFLRCDSKPDGVARAERLADTIGLAVRSEHPVTRHGNRWTITGLHDQFIVSVEGGSGVV